MPRYEYKVVPAPLKGRKAKGVKTPEARFALSVEQVMNAMAAEGWEYQRAELLPSEERSGLTGSVTQWRNLLVFRRADDSDPAQFDAEPLAIAAPEADAESDAETAGQPEAATDAATHAATQAEAGTGDGAEDAAPDGRADAEDAGDARDTPTRS